MAAQSLCCETHLTTREDAGAQADSRQNGELHWELEWEERLDSIKSQTAFWEGQGKSSRAESHFHSASQKKRRKHKALPQARKNSPRFATKMQGRKHVALRVFQERLFIICLSAAINSSASSFLLSYMNIQHTVL